MSNMSLEGIKTKFDLKSNSIDELRTELKLKMKDCHQDKVEKSEWENGLKLQFLELNEALEFVDNLKKNDTALVPIEQVTELVKVIKDILPTKDINNQETKFYSQLESFLHEKKDNLRLPKISLSVVTVILSFVWLFPQAVADHPVLKNWIDFKDELFLVSWVIVLICIVVFWLIILKKENNDKSLIKYIKTERAQYEIFQQFIVMNCNEEFNKAHLIRFILKNYGNFRREVFIPKLLKIRSGIDEETAEALANLLIQKAIQNGVVEINTQKASFLEIYKIKNIE